LDEEARRLNAGQTPLFWGVRSQRLALERLLARFSVSSSVTAPQLASCGREELARLLEQPIQVTGWVELSLPYLPPRCQLVIRLLGISPSGEEHEWIRIPLNQEEFNGENRFRIGEKNWRISDLSYGGPGHVFLILNDHLPRFYPELVVSVELSLGKGATLSCRHRLLHLQRKEHRGKEGDTRLYGILVESNSEQDFANAFSNVIDFAYSGG